MCQDCDWQDYVSKCEEILNCDDMEWCSGTVDSIKDWVEENAHITERQQGAIDNYFRIYEEKYS